MLKVDLAPWVDRLKSMQWETLDPSIDAVVAELKRVAPNLAKRIDKSVAKWRHETEGSMILIVLDGSPENGEQLVFAIIFGPRNALDHVHGESPFTKYGELYWTFEGELEDSNGKGEVFIHRPGNPPVEHKPNTRHAPRVPRFWIGAFYHPAPSRLP